MHISMGNKERLQKCGAKKRQNTIGFFEDFQHKVKGNDVSLIEV